MKKIMFNDRYALTEAVLKGKKTQTRRLLLPYHNCMSQFYEENTEAFKETCLRNLAKYQIGEVVAVAQRYSDVAHYMLKHNLSFFFDSDCAGWTNKMFVRADLMPHQICFTNRRVERLQEISDEDCLAEGVQNICDFYGFPDTEKDDWGHYNTPREAYASLIDKVSGKGIWDSNPWVLAYDFELVM